MEKELDLTYGENPHQRAALYVESGVRSHVLSRVAKLHGKPLSFNNVLDLDSARRLCSELEGAGCVIVKHNNPCGVAEAEASEGAYEAAFACDPTSAFGGVIALNRPVSRARRTPERAVRRGSDRAGLRGRCAAGAAAEGGHPHPRGHRAARAPGRAGRQAGARRHPGPGPDGSPGAARADGGRDQDAADPEQWADLLFAWRVVRHVRSNAIVLARGGATLGIGAGQMSRVDSVRIAIEKAREARGPDVEQLLAGSVIASDAFFPFADGVQTAIDVGVSAVIEPGGSKRDAEVIEACDSAGVPMVFTKRRHFRH